MTPSADIAAFQSRLGHDFADPDLLLRALTHASLAGEARPDNERLEFLGDRVLGLVVADALLGADPAAREGDLAPRLNALVRKEACAAVARAIDLGAVLRIGRSERMSGGRRKEALLADAMEAVIAAIYLDAGFQRAGEAVRRLWAPLMAAVASDARDPKTQLQEWAQGRGEPPPDYVETAREGPDHAPVFTVEARLASGGRATGRASSKRAAEKDAAARLLAALSGGGAGA